MARPKTLTDLKPCPWNPRSITPEALLGLQASTREFGDLSGIVFNLRSGHLVTAHQRIEALKRSQKIEYDPNKQAIVTEGGDEYPVRLVDWPEATEKAANVAANSPHIAGDWTDGLGPILDELKAELPDLTAELRLGELVNDIPVVIPEPQPPSEKAGLTCPECGYVFSEA